MDMQTSMDIGCEEVLVQDAVGAEVELQQDTESETQQCSLGSLSSSMPEHYRCLDDSSDEEDLTAANQEATIDSCTSPIKEDFVCWECGEEFVVLDSLMVHFRTHSANVRCHLCQVTFSRGVSLAMHLDNAHHEVALFCPTCNMTFSSRWHLNDHLKKHHYNTHTFPKTEVQSAEEGSEFTPSTQIGPEEEDEVEKVVVEEEEVVIQEQEIVVKTEMMEESEVVEEPKENRLRNTAPEDHTYNGSLMELINNDHTYNNIKEMVNNMKVPTVKSTKDVKDPTTYALRIRHTKTLTKVFPRETLPASAHRKKLQVFVLRSAPQTGQGAGACKAILESMRTELLTSQAPVKNHVQEEEDIKPDISTSRPSLPDPATAPSDRAQQDQGKVVVKQEPDADPWECAPIQWEDELNKEIAQRQVAEEEVFEEDVAEEEVVEEGMQSDDQEDDDSLPPGDSAYSPDEGSDTDSQSSSSSDKSRSSSGDSYACRRKGKGCNRTSGAKGANDAKKQKPSSSTEVTMCCSNCGAGPFCKLGYLKNHMNYCRTGGLTCPLCNRECDNETLLLEHKAQAHSCMYACGVCLQVFPDNICYKNHHCSNTPQKLGDQAPGTGTIQVGQSFPSIRITLVPSAAGAVCAQNAGGSLRSASASAPSPIVVSNSGSVKILNRATVAVPGQKPGPVPQLSLSGVPRSSSSSSFSSSQAGSMPVLATVVYSGDASSGKVTRVVLHGCQGLPFPTSMQTQVAAAQTNSARMHASAPSQTKIVAQNSTAATMQLTNLLLQGVVQPQALIGSAQPPGPAPAPVGFSAPFPVAVPVSAPSKVPTPATMHSQTLAPGSHKVSYSYTPTPVRNTTRAPVSMSLSNPAPALVRAPVSTVLVPMHAPLPAAVRGAAPVPVPAGTRAMAPLLSATSAPLKVVAMFVNQSKEVALQQRLRKSWRSKAVFLCRQCGAISRQPSLGVRHRYLHRGSRLHRCQCGRRFQRRLHLLRHQVQHAEAVRYVCAPCGETFDGALLLARHKQGWRRRPLARKRLRKECSVPFLCDCGQAFLRPSTLLWHKLTNARRLKPPKS